MGYVARDAQSVCLSNLDPRTPIPAPPTPLRGWVFKMYSTHINQHGSCIGAVGLDMGCKIGQIHSYALFRHMDVVYYPYGPGNGNSGGRTHSPCYHRL